MTLQRDERSQASNASPSELNFSEIFQQYENALGPARQQFTNGLAFTEIMQPELEPRLLCLWLIYFSALGVAMTHPVENWIQRAGLRCLELGYSEIGKFLLIHAKQEANHDLMLVEDLHYLITYWNKHFIPVLNAEQLLKQPLTKGVRDYQELHESVIAGSQPYLQLAIEGEIERLSLVHGKQLWDQCLRLLGAEIKNGLKFVTSHVSLDVYHDIHNREQLNQLLRLHPAALPGLVETGQQALLAYSQFLVDCLGLAHLTAKVGEKQS